MFLVCCYLTSSLRCILRAFNRFKHFFQLFVKWLATPFFSFLRLFVLLWFHFTVYFELVLLLPIIFFNLHFSPIFLWICVTPYVGPFYLSVIIDLFLPASTCYSATNSYFLQITTSCYFSQINYFLLFWSYK